MIYADHAATTKLDIDAFEAMKPFLLECYGNPSQKYSFSRETRKVIRKAREDIAECIGACPEEIFFTSGGSESDNWIIKGYSCGEKYVKHIITSNIEHHAILNSVKSEVKKGRADALYLPADDKGIVQPDKLEKALIQLQNRGYSSQSQLVSVMLANNEIGTIQPIKELTEISRKYGALFHTDAVQAVGHIPINVNDLGVSMLSASAHKFNGPKGVGFLYSKERLDSFIDGGSQEKGHRAGTENVAGIVGMAAALKKNTAHIVENSTKLKKLEKQLMEALHSSNIDFLRNGTRQLPGNVSLSFAGADGEMIFHRMDLMHIFISTGSACNSGSTDVSHVISAIGVPDYYAKGTIRISLGIDNTDQDITEIVRALSSIINK